MNLSTSGEQADVTPEFLSGGGEMGRRIREFDWSSTSLGPVNTWPQSLRTCIRIMLGSRQPIWIGWGKDLIKLYNDPYREIVRGKHPWALGKPAEIVWREIWPTIGPMLQQVMENDEGTYVESQFLAMERNGYPEETYYTFSYTPIQGDNGGTAGMICFNTDDTDRIISERQLNTLTHLGKQLTDCQTAQDVIRRTIDTLRENPFDFPVAGFYVLAGDKASLAAGTGHPGTTGPTDEGTTVKRTAEGRNTVKSGYEGENTAESGQDEGNAAKSAHETGGSTGSILFSEIDLNGRHRIVAAVNQALQKKQPQIIDAAADFQGGLRGPWELPPSKIMVLPFSQSGEAEPYGLLVTGLNPYRLPDEKYSGFFSIIADQVTKSFGNVYVLEQERKRAQALAEIDQAKTTFFSNISHEFRTPLTLLLGPIEDALRDPEDVTQNRLRMDVAYRNALRMQKLVNTLLEFSRIEAGRLEGRFSRVDVCILTADLASSFRSAIEKAGMTLNLELEPVTAEVYVDPTMFEKIILNLVSNAFKYTSEGEIDVAVRERNGEVRISVRDTGIGIPEDQLDRIFDRFHRVENAAVRTQEGTGIGLSLVRELVKLHHGRIEVESHLGQGSTFTVVLPSGKIHLDPDRIVSPEAIALSKERNIYVEESLRWLPDARTAEYSPEWQAGRRHMVLLAEDNADMRDYVGRLLSGQYHVVTAKNGEEAFEMMQKAKPDLLLSDVMMPKLDGFGLLQRVRQHPGLRTIPVIMLSARAGEESKLEGLRAGADDYLVKPFSARELVARVDANLRINAARRVVEQELTSFLMQAPFAIIILSGPNFVIDLVNDKCLPIIRRNREEVVGRPVLDVAPEGLKGFKPILDEIRQKGEPALMAEQEIRLDQGGKSETVYFTIAFQPLKRLDGQVERIMIVVADVTETVDARRRSEQYAGLLEAEVRKRTQQLNQLNATLRQSNEDLRQFAHVASHDLKEPVRKVKVFAGRLEDDPGTSFSAKGRSYLDKIDSAANRMLTMIEGVLHYSTVNSVSQETEAVDLNRVIRAIELDLEVPIADKGASLHYSGLPTVEGAALLLYQLFYNLINNSLKFSRADQACRIDITAVVENGHALISLKDNGIGFDQGESERIFDSFFRLNARDKYEGTGLGLALCKKIAVRHGGDIEAIGIKGTGSEFRIRLPLRGGIGRLI